MFKLAKYEPYALAVLRIVTALIYGEHGTQKLLHFPPMGGFPGGGGGGGAGAGPPPGGGMPASMQVLFLIGGIIELVGGLGLLLGVLTRPIAFVVAGELAVIYWWMHVPMGGFFPVANGGESAVLMCFTALYLVFAGPGAWSVDGWMRGRRTPPA